MTQQLKDVYDDEFKKIQEVGVSVQRTWRQEIAPKLNLADTKATAKKLNEWTKVVEGAFEKIGFRAAVDVNPIYGDKPPEITILERLHGSNITDHERKSHEVNKGR